MSFIEEMKKRAKTNIKKIVLPEATDIRVLKATEQISKEKFAKIVLLGNEEKIKHIAEENSIIIDDAEIIEPSKSEKYDEYANSFYELRKAKGMTIEKARELMHDETYFGMMMVKMQEADGLVSGAIHSTADTLRPALQILKTAPGTKLVSAFFVMVVPNCEYGENGVFVFSDCGLNENPDAENLTEKVINATNLVKEKMPELEVDGELQLDAAIIPEIAKSKAPGSNVAGKANTLIFPDLNAGNIGYKLVQRLAKAESYGPLCQGIAKPVNDLSRGCSSEDIVGVVAITAVQAQNL